MASKEASPEPKALEDAKEEEKRTTSTNKIEVMFKNTGNAPILKKSKWSVVPNNTVADSLLFLRKYLKLDPSQSLFLYVNQTFAPPLDQTFQNLYDTFESDKKLVLYYSYTPAWG